MREAFARIETADRPILALALVLTLALGVLFLACLRWRAVLAGLNAPLPLGLVLRLTMSGAFFNETVPSGGGDLARAWLAHRTGLPPGAAVRSVVVDRTLALFGLLLLVTPLLPFTLELLPDARLRAGAVIATAIGLAFVCGLLVLDRLPLPARWAARATPALGQIPATLRRVLRDGRFALHVLVPAIAVHALRVVIVYVIAASLAVGLNLVECFILLPIALLVASIPISLNGWGLREGVFAVVLSAAGVSLGDAVAISLCFGLASLGAGLFGALAWMSLRIKSPLPAR